MIGFRDEEPTYAQAAQAVVERLEDVDPGEGCRACGNTVADCDRYHDWCLGRTARATRENRSWRRQFLNQLELVISMHEFWPKDAHR